MSEFAKLLARLIDGHGHTQESWAKLVGITQGHVSNLIAGRRPPALDSIDDWADSFRLTGDARDRFRRLAMAAHLPEPLRVEMERVVTEHASRRRPRDNA